MIDTSPSIAALAAAMAKAQATIEGAIKDSANPHFKSKYADLASVWQAWQKAGPANGLAVMQFPGQCADNRLEMTTVLTHASGEWIKATLTIPLAKVDAQGYGSATTYARRYALAAAVGIAPEDDDGNAASQPKGAANNAPRRAPSESVAFIDEAQITRLQMLLEATGISPVKFCQTMGCKTVASLPADQFDAAIDRLETRLAKLAKEQTDKEAA